MIEFGKERAYFDFENLQNLGPSNISIILGYKASIDLYGGRLLLCAELASKLINQNTVLDVNIFNAFLINLIFLKNLLNLLFEK